MLGGINNIVDSILMHVVSNFNEEGFFVYLSAENMHFVVRFCFNNLLDVRPGSFFSRAPYILTVIFDLYLNFQIEHV